MHPILTQNYSAPDKQYRVQGHCIFDGQSDARCNIVLEIGKIEQVQPMKKYKYLFGPVLSRRFGRSLGVDLIPLKTCTMDCIFCQLGHSRRKTVVRREYAPVERVAEEIAHWLGTGEAADCITLSGSGEPTLHSRFGEIIDFIHEHTTIPVLLLTNSSLLHLARVRRDAARADIVKVSLSAWDQRSFNRVNRPCGKISFKRLVKGLETFRSEFKGVLLMEVFLVPGLNSGPQAAARIARLAAGIRPDRIQFNTAIRPPADRSILPVSAGRMNSLSKLFTPKAELIRASKPGVGKSVKADGDAILALLRRHPCTVSQVAKASNIPVRAALKCLEQLMKTGKIATRHMKKKVYYVELA